MNNLKTILKEKKGTIVLLICAAILLAITLNLDKVSGFFSWLWNAFTPIVIGLAIAFVLNILMDFFSSKVFKHIEHNRLKTTLSLILSLLVIIFIIVAVILIVIPQLSESFRLLAQNIPEALEKLRATLENLTKNYPVLNDALSNFKTTTTDLSSSLTEFVKNVLPKTLSSTYSFAVSSAKGVLTVLIAILFSLYVLIFKKSLGQNSRELCYSFFSTKVANKILYIAHLLSAYFKDFIYGRVVNAICFALIYLVLGFIFRLPYTVMLTTIFAVFTIVPLFGALIAWIVGLFLITPTSIVSAIIFTIIFVIILLVTRNVIYPRVIGKSIGLPDFWVLFAIVIGGKLFGIVGILTAVPVFALIYTLIKEFVVKKVKEDPKKVDEMLNQPQWDNYNPETGLFEDKPVIIEDPLAPKETKKK